MSRSRKTSNTTVLLAALSAVLLTMFLVGAPVFAHHKGGHSQGPPSSAQDKGGGGSGSADQSSASGSRSEKADSADAAKPDDAGKPSDAGGGESAKGGNGNPNPPGNNGTVKIHSLGLDPDDRRNVPHVGCLFEVLYFGGDSGQELSWTFWGWAPTGGGALDYDGPTGGTLDADGYGRWVIDMTNSFEGITPHPQQGYHVKLDVATGEPGGQKHKVFWVKCPEEVLPQEEVLPEVGGEIIGEIPTAGAPEAAPEVLGGLVRQGQPKPQAEVLGERVSRAVLPFTGGNVMGLALLALALVAGGGVLLRSRSR